jgi:hypothetical protein
MLSGSKITEKSFEHANELLSTILETKIAETV